MVEKEMTALRMMCVCLAIGLPLGAKCDSFFEATRKERFQAHLMYTRPNERRTLLEDLHAEYNTYSIREAEGLPPWALPLPASERAEFVIIVSTQRSASTETAELIGKHPCGVSFNELLWAPQFPLGYAYNENKQFKDYLGVKVIGRENWLGNALGVRRGFCQSRPQVVLDACGDLCVVALKIHLNQENLSGPFVIQTSEDGRNETAIDAQWEKLLTYHGTRAVIVERDEEETRCSIARAQRMRDWGHTPDAHKVTYNATPCASLMTNDKWASRVRESFNVSRAALRRAARPYLELPFAYWVANTHAAENKLFKFAGLIRPPKVFEGKCWQPWCKSYSWPTESTSSSPAIISNTDNGTITKLYSEILQNAENLSVTSFSKYLNHCHPRPDEINVRRWMGRSGNRLHQLVVAFSLAINSGRSYVTTPRWFDDVWNVSDRIEINSSLSTNLMQSNLPCAGFRASNNDCTYVIDKRCSTTVADRRNIYLQQIRPLLRYEVISTCEPLSNETLVIHLRDGDVATDTSSPHAQPPCAYFHDVILFGNNGVAFKWVLLVHSNQEPLNPCVSELSARHTDKLGSLDQPRTVINDTCMVLQAKNLALTSSSFGITLAMMSHNVARLFVIDVVTAVGLNSQTSNDHSDVSESTMLARKIEDFELNVTQLCSVFPQAIHYSLPFNGTFKAIAKQLDLVKDTSGNSTVKPTLDSKEFKDEYFLRFHHYAKLVKTSCQAPLLHL